jgi:tRNA threonylcarbamoyladenosine biosynthesis protein TsaB
MTVILNIDTAIETAGVSISKNGNVQSFLINTIQKDHASFLHNAIKKVLADAALKMEEVSAIAVTHGPGSYTGIRVGMSAAKGLCYALTKPLITISTLEALAKAAINVSNNISDTSLFCPMIDARRMEVYTALYDHNMKEVMPPNAMIIDENSFHRQLQKNECFFFGSGATKFKNLINSVNARFISNLDIIPSMAQLSFEKFQRNELANIAYAEPLYIKEFYSS